MNRKELENKIKSFKSVVPDKEFAEISRSKIIAFAKANPICAKSFDIRPQFFGFRRIIPTLAVFAILAVMFIRPSILNNNENQLAGLNFENINQEWANSDITPYLKEIFASESSDQVDGALSQLTMKIPEGKNSSFLIRQEAEKINLDNELPVLTGNEVDQMIDELTF